MDGNNCMSITTTTGNTWTFNFNNGWKFCPQCGHKLEDSWMFCPSCGTAKGNLAGSWIWNTYPNGYYVPPTVNPNTQITWTATSTNSPGTSES